MIINVTTITELELFVHKFETVVLAAAAAEAVVTVAQIVLRAVVAFGSVIVIVIVDVVQFWSERGKEGSSRFMK